jgi:hypothetical protein
MVHFLTPSWGYPALPPPYLLAAGGIFDASFYRVWLVLRNEFGWQSSQGCGAQPQSSSPLPSALKCYRLIFDLTAHQFIHSIKISPPLFASTTTTTSSSSSSSSRYIVYT